MPPLPRELCTQPENVSLSSSRVFRCHARTASAFASVPVLPQCFFGFSASS